jgi:hypothetical protein
MSGSFDPYHKWLGISPKDQPPNHYRLLAVDLFESDPDVISSAADQRMAHVRAFQTGKHSALSQQILNEIAAARVCLLNAEKRTDYDRKLREQLDLEGGGSEPADEAIQARPEPPVLPPLPPATPPLDEPVAPRFEGTLPRPWLRRKKWAWQAVVGILVAAILLLAVMIAVLSRGGPEEVAVGNTQTQPISQPGLTEPLELPPQKSGPTATENENPPDAQAEPPEANQGGPSEPPPEQSNQGEPPEPTPVEPPEEGGPGEPPIQVVGQGEKQTADPPPETPPEKAPVPDAPTQADAEQRLEGIVAAATAAEYLAAARAQKRTPEERFVLLKKARDAAVSNKDVQTALAATEEIVGRYEIDALALKVETFNVLRESVRTPSAIRALGENGLVLVDELVAKGQKDSALGLIEHVLSMAVITRDSELHGQAAIRYNQLNASP